MAKNSSNDDSKTSELKNEKKLKKKRAKSEGNENEDEEQKPEVKSKKHKRKKSKVSEATGDEHSPKKSKKAESKEADDTEQANEDTEDKPKTKKSPSNRQLKRSKKEAKELEKKEASKQESIKKALTYISTWKHGRSQWKFEKLKQIWLMDHLLDEALVPDHIFPTVLEYFEGCKGMARETLLKKGMDVIKKYEQQQEVSGEIVESVEYERARQLLQALPVET